MLQPGLQALLNGLVSGTLLAAPAIGFSAIFAVLRYPNFAIGALATVGAYAGWVANVQLGLPLEPALLFAFAGAGVVLENVVRFAFGNDLRGYDLPLLRDWRFGEFRIGPQQVENFALALGLMA